MGLPQTRCLPDCLRGVPSARDIEKLPHIRQSYFSYMQPEVDLIPVLLVVEAGATMIVVAVPRLLKGGPPPEVDCLDMEVVGYLVAPIHHHFLFRPYPLLSPQAFQLFLR